VIWLALLPPLLLVVVSLLGRRSWLAALGGLVGASLLFIVSLAASLLQLVVHFAFSCSHQAAGCTTVSTNWPLVGGGFAVATLAFVVAELSLRRFKRLREVAKPEPPEEPMAATPSSTLEQ
jgi:hypothetical protein